MVWAPIWQRVYPEGVRWDANLDCYTLGELLDRTAKRAPDNVMFEFRDCNVTYRDADRIATQFAAGLLTLGIRPGDRIALYMPNTPYHTITLLGIAKAGACTVHLTPLDTRRELAHKLWDSGARILVTIDNEAMLANADALHEERLIDFVIVGDDEAWLPEGDSRHRSTVAAWRILFQNLLDRAANSEVNWRSPELDDLAILQYTGGTTGSPKGAMLSHRNISTAISSMNAWLNVQPFSDPGNDRHICVLPLFHVFALIALVLRAIANGDRIFLHARFEVEAVLNDIEKKRATFFFAVPTMLIALCNDPSSASRDFSSLRLCAAGGAALPTDVARRIEEITGNQIAVGWGMTETASVGTITLAKGANRTGSVGLPVPGVYLDVVDLNDPRKLLPAGVVGELRVGGRNVTAGYWNCERENAQAFIDGMLLTGDIGYIDEHGFVFIVDRKKDMIISGGFNVYPRAIEDAIYEHPDVEETLVVGIPNEYRGEAAKAFVKLRAGAVPFSLEELRGFLGDKIGRQALPTALEFRDAMPRTAVGKFSKKELRSTAQDKPTNRE